MSAAYDVVAVGNAIVDVLAHADDEFLVANGLPKGGMRLIDAAEAEGLYGRMGPGIEISGGSAANTIAGLASLGGQGAYIGKVAADQLGQVFSHDIRALGVHFATRPLHEPEVPTARCLILISPDAQRTMATYLGASQRIGPEDLDAELIRAAQVTYLEGYLFDRDPARQAFFEAADLARSAGRKVALTLSDTFCVERHRAEFLRLIAGHVDILFANEAEICALYETTSFDTAARTVRGHADTVCLTRSERGSVILVGNETVLIEAEPVERLVDTTGAGDLYAAGFLFGHTRGLEPTLCGRIASIAAAEVISHVGARPQADLAALVRAAGIAV